MSSPFTLPQRHIVYAASPPVPRKTSSATNLLNIIVNTTASLCIPLAYHQDDYHSCYSNGQNSLLLGLPRRRECDSQAGRKPVLAHLWVDGSHFWTSISGSSSLCQGLHKGPTGTEHGHQFHSSHFELKLFFQPGRLCHKAKVV